MTNEELYEKWRNENSRIDRHGVSPTSIGHKHIQWNDGVDRRKAYLDGLEEGRKEVRLTETTYVNRLHFVEKENEELKEEVEYWKNEYYYLKANPEEA